MNTHLLVFQTDVCTVYAHACACLVVCLFACVFKLECNRSVCISNRTVCLPVSDNWICLSVKLHRFLCRIWWVFLLLFRSKQWIYFAIVADFKFDSVLFSVFIPFCFFLYWFQFHSLHPNNMDTRKNLAINTWLYVMYVCMTCWQFAHISHTNLTNTDLVIFI